MKKKDRLLQLRALLKESERQLRIYEGRRKQAETFLRRAKNFFFEICYKWEVADRKEALRRLNDK